MDAFASSKDLSERARLVVVIRGVDDPFAEIGKLPGSEQEVLRPILATIETANLKSRVSFLNLKSQHALACAYRILARRRSVFALTSFYEPFGLAPIEAAACGLAVVATKNGGPSEIFLDDAGVLVDPADPQDIARGLILALDNYEVYAKRGRRRVAEKYTWRATAGGYLDVIRRRVGQVRSVDDGVPELGCAALIDDYLGTA